MMALTGDDYARAAAIIAAWTGPERWSDMIAEPRMRGPINQAVERLARDLGTDGLRRATSR